MVTKHNYCTTSPSKNISFSPIETKEFLLKIASALKLTVLICYTKITTFH